MNQIAHHQSSDGTHILTVPAEFGSEEASEIVGLLAEIAYTNNGIPAYAVINMCGHYILPLREFSGHLKRLYREMPDNQPLFLAMLVDPSVVNVLSTIVKTLVRRESIQYFTDESKAHLWLGIERKKQLKR